MKLKANLSHKPVFICKDRFCVVYGGAGSGKSVAIAQKILLRIIAEPHHKILIVRKVARTLRASVYQLITDLIYDLELQDNFNINKTDMSITNNSNRSSILFKGLDDVEKLKSIVGITSIWVEEASELLENDLNELNRRLRGITPYYKQIILSFNPISHLHWLKKRFIDNPPENTKYFKSTYLDNKFIDDEYKLELESIKQYDLQQYRIYALGEWGVLDTNLVYHTYKPELHITQKTIKDFGAVYVGMDFNVGGCVAIICGIEGDTCYVVDSVVEYDTRTTAYKLQQKTRGKMVEICPDSSGKNQSSNSSKSDVQILQSMGFRVNAPSINPRVVDRINTVNKMFFEGKLLVNVLVHKLVFALQTQKYLENGTPEKFNDHKNGAVDDWCDSLGYIVNRKFGIIKPNMGIHRMPNRN